MSRETKRTKARDKRFFEALESNPTVTVAKAAKAAGYSRSSIYNYKNDDPLFASRFNEIMDERFEELESAAYDMAINGEDDYKTIINPKTGKKSTIKVKRRNSSVVMFLLSAGKPEKYRSNYKPPELDDHDLDSISDEELDAEIARYENL